MPSQIIWSDARDAMLRRMRAEGCRWADIADAFGISRSAAIERGRRIGAPRPPREHVRPDPVTTDLARPPLPAGHPRSWGLITAGTLLDGAAWPLPQFFPEGVSR